MPPNGKSNNPCGGSKGPPPNAFNFSPAQLCTLVMAKQGVVAVRFWKSIEFSVALASRKGGGVQGLALIFIPAGGGGLHPTQPNPTEPPSPLRFQFQFHYRWGLQFR